MALTFSTLVKNNRLDEISAEIDGGGGAGKIRIYDGTQPSHGGAATTLLAELTFNATSFAAATGGTMTANAIVGETSAPNAGTATWFRVLDFADTIVMDGTAGTSGTDLILDNDVIAATQAVDINSFVLTEGN